MKTWILAVLVGVAYCSRADDGATYRGRTGAEWAKLLSDKDNATRLQAITAVLAIGKDDGIDAARVAPLLDDADIRIRAKAASWLALVTRDPRALEVARQVLIDMPMKGNRENEADTDAIDAIGRMGWAGRGMLPELEKRLAYYERIEPDGAPASTVLGREMRALRNAIKSIREDKPKAP